MASDSLLERAKSLKVMAGRLGDDDEQRQKEQKTVNALDKLEAALGDLESAVKAYAKASDLGIAPTPSPNWQDGLSVLQEHVARGTPAPQALTGATGKVLKNVAAAMGPLGLAWSEWSANSLESLKADRVPLLAESARRDTEERLATLRKMSRDAPTSALMGQFTITLGIVRDALDSIQASGPLQEALKKMTSGARLNAYTDAEIACLRADEEVAAQIVLRRQQ